MSSEAEACAANIIPTVSPTIDSSCDWQLTKEKLTQRGNHILETEQWADCTFIVGEETVKAHKLILAMSSPVFEAMFFGKMAEKNNPIEIADARPEVFKALLQYIYTDNVKLRSSEIAYELCYCAKKYMFPFLVEECMKFILSDLSPGTVFRIYEFTKLFEKPLLMEKCLQMIRTMTDIVLFEPSFEEIQLETLVTILEQTELNIYSENQLIIAVERWARFKCIKNGLDPVDGEALRSVIGNALTKIRFLSLTPQEFAQGPARSLLLRENEAFDISKNILSNEKNLPMPEGFSTSVQSRTNGVKQEHMTNVFSTVVVMADTSGTNKTVDPNTGLNKIQTLQDFSLTDNLLYTVLDKRSGKSEHGSEYYCHRFTLGKINSPVSGRLECFQPFVVNRSICIMGIQVPSQIEKVGGSYFEELTVTLYINSWSLLCTQTFTPRVYPGNLVQLMFATPVYVKANVKYTIKVVFGKAGYYPLLHCRDNLSFDGWEFKYLESNNGELLTSIIYFPAI